MLFLKRNRKIIFIFVIYLISHFIFANWYYSIYKNDSENFLITKEIIDFQKQAIDKTVTIEVNEVDLTIEALAKKRAFLELFQDSIIKKRTQKELVLAFKKGRLYRINNTTFVCDIKYREIAINVVSYKLDIYHNDKFEDSFLIEVGTTKTERLLKMNINDLFSGKINQISEGINISKSEIKAIESEKKKIWSYSDFLYFSTGYISGDITPNSSKVRRLVLSQRLIEALLFVLLINLTFKTFSSTRKNKNQSTKTKLVAISKDAKLVLDILIKKERTSIDDIKTESSLSKKRVTLALQELQINNLIKTSRTDNELFIQIINLKKNTTNHNLN